MLENQHLPIHYLLSAALGLFYIALFFIEMKHPLRARKQSIMHRLWVNMLFTVLVFISASLFINPVVQHTLAFTRGHEFSLLTLISNNPLFIFISGFLLMDLSFYYWHRLNHKIPLLWRFHNVHHVDLDLDVTTSMRFHWVEIAYSSVFRLFQLAIISPNPLTFICYEFIFQASTFFHHSNIQLPIKLERWLNKIVVTPRMHGIHHSNYRDETNSNYSVIFSFWDRIHETLKLNVPQQSITIGVPGYQNTADNTLIRLLLMPFKIQRQYWQPDQLNRSQSQIKEEINQLSD